jgi:hypothetical protein
MEQASSETSSHHEAANEVGQVETDRPVENEPQPVKRSSWTLVQCEEFTQDYNERVVARRFVSCLIYSW